MTAFSIHFDFSLGALVALVLIPVKVFRAFMAIVFVTIGFVQWALVAFLWALGIPVFADFALPFNFVLTLSALVASLAIEELKL